MTKVDIFSGFLGAGKTTLIKKLIAEAYTGEKLVLIENEFGDIAIDGGFMQDAGIEVTEMNSGCICCSLVGDFEIALGKVVSEFAPDRILIEPSGVGKLSDIIRAVAAVEGLTVNSATTVVDALKCKKYAKNFGEFYDDQIKNARAVILSRTAGMAQDALDFALELLRERNSEAVIVTTAWDELDGKAILAAMEGADTLEHELHELEHAHHHHHHDHDEHCTCGCHDHDHEHHHHHDDECHHEHEHHHHHEHDEHCTCGCHDHDHEHHHHHDNECHHEHEHHHHHEHDEHCTCGCHDHDHEHHHHHDDECHHEHEHHHHHEHDEHCTCGCHDHDHEHHHHHHADEVFASWGMETAKKFTAEGIEKILASLDDEERFGVILRAKGIVAAEDGQWLHFDHVPGENNIRRGSAGITGRFCVIGSHINEHELAELFGI